MRPAGGACCVWEEPMLKFEDPNKGPRRLLPEDVQDLGEDLRLELDRLVSLLHPADAITEERARAQIQATPARSSVDKSIRDLEARGDTPALFR
jgi:hypothetical protein